MLQHGAALRALEAYLCSLVKLKPHAQARADVEQAFVCLFPTEALLKLLKPLALSCKGKIVKRVRLQSPVADVPALLPVLLPVVTDKIAGLHRVKHLSHRINLCFYALSYLELGDVLLALQVLHNRHSFLANNLGNSLKMAAL